MSVVGPGWGPNLRGCGLSGLGDRVASSVDITSLDALKAFLQNVKDAGGQIHLCGVKSGLNEMLLHSELADEIGTADIFLSEDEVFASSNRALERAKQMIQAQDSRILKKGKALSFRADRFCIRRVGTDCIRYCLSLEMLDIWLNHKTLDFRKLGPDPIHPLKCYL